MVCAVSVGAIVVRHRMIRLSERVSMGVESAVGHVYRGAQVLAFASAVPKPSHELVSFLMILVCMRKLFRPQRKASELIGL